MRVVYTIQYVMYILDGAMAARLRQCGWSSVLKCANTTQKYAIFLTTLQLSLPLICDQVG